MTLGFLIGIVAIVAFVVGVLFGISLPFFWVEFRFRLLWALQELTGEEIAMFRRARMKLKKRDEL